jgi:PTH1 family peptidyl-tRNA hydrolase
MNASGEALLHYGDFVPSSLLVVCDDINLPLGRMRLRRSGGSGGHLGIESIISCIDDDGFARLRIGVGSPPPGIDWSDYVLERFPVSEREAANRLVDTAADAIEIIVRDGLGAAMQEYNRRDQS